MYPERAKTVDLKAKYGITVEHYNQMREQQQGRCVICGSSDKRLVVDHNHRTGKVRGLLCHLCTAMIGCVREEPDILTAALAYLHAERHLDAGPVQTAVSFGPARAERA